MVSESQNHGLLSATERRLYFHAGELNPGQQRVVVQYYTFW